MLRRCKTDGSVNKFGLTYLREFASIRGSPKSPARRLLFRVNRGVVNSPLLPFPSASQNLRYSMTKALRFLLLPALAAALAWTAWIAASLRDAPWAATLREHAPSIFLALLLLGLFRLLLRGTWKLRS